MPTNNCPKCSAPFQLGVFSCSHCGTSRNLSPKEILLEFCQAVIEGTGASFSTTTTGPNRFRVMFAPNSSGHWFAAGAIHSDNYDFWTLGVIDPSESILASIPSQNELSLRFRETSGGKRYELHFHFDGPRLDGSLEVDGRALPSSKTFQSFAYLIRQRVQNVQQATSPHR